MGVHSRNTEIPRQQDEVQGTSEVAMVLSGLPETMSRRQWIQVSCPIRSPSKTDARRWRERWSTHRRLLFTVPTRFRPVAFTKVCPTLLLLDLCCFLHHQQIRHEARQGQHRLPRVHSRQTSPTHELHTMGHVDRVREASRKNRSCTGGRDGEGLVSRLDR
jgi:hypothetical protein